jgi:hypothetical protein
MLVLILAFLGGVLTILSPGILPVLPLVFARSDRPFMRNGSWKLPPHAALTRVTQWSVGEGWTLHAENELLESTGGHFVGRFAGRHLHRVRSPGAQPGRSGSAYVSVTTRLARIAARIPMPMATAASPASAYINWCARPVASARSISNLSVLAYRPMPSRLADRK